MELFSTSCESIYLGWDTPLLKKVSDELQTRFRQGDYLDLSEVDCVLPSTRSCDRLRELLQQASDEKKLRCQLPRLMTLGSLAELLYEPTKTLATDFEQTLAWARAIRRFSPDELESLIPVAPPSEPLAPWLELAGTLSSLASELASQDMTFDRVSAMAEGEVECRRWHLLQRIQDAYLEELFEAGLSDPAAERILAISQNRCRARRTTVLIGTSDLNPVVLRMLRCVDKNLIAMIGAPEALANKFNEFGSVISSQWQDYRISIHDDQLIPASDMMDQAVAVASQIRVFGAHHSPDEITVGVTDDSQVAPIELELRCCGVTTNRHLGWTLSDTSPGRLLQLTSLYLQRQTWQSLASLVRHGHCHRWITSKLDNPNTLVADSWHSQLDHFIANHFPVRVDDAIPPRAIEKLPKVALLRDLVAEWLKPFEGAPCRVAEWSQRLLEWLSGIYEIKEVQGGFADNTHSPLIKCQSAQGMDSPQLDLEKHALVQEDKCMGERTGLALRTACRFLKGVSALNPALDMECSGGVAIEMLTNRLGFLRILETPQSDEIDILGWLDLALDDAPALVVNGFNHPFVPSVAAANSFLPSELRLKLSTDLNDRRYARDLYSMQSLLMSRSLVRFIVGKVGIDQSPTPPSRLLAASERDRLPGRLIRVMEGQRETTQALHRWDKSEIGAGLGVPELNGLVGGEVPQIKSLSVTAFRDYLICPYRFFLRHVLKARPIDDSSRELAANQFGDLVHGALEDFGNSDDRDESDPQLIEMHLKKYLHQYVQRWYSSHSSSAVQIQVSQAEKRLRRVAQVQADRIADGWRIHQVEASVGPNEGACIAVGDRSLPVKGRFDRIDVRRADGLEEWAILDYKTHGYPPEKKHLRKTTDGYQWIDLQLPLYRMMVPYLGITVDPSRVKLGYFNISGKDEETRINEADFSEKLMLEAERLVKQCVSGILDGNFEPTENRVEYDDYEVILQTGVASRLLNQAAGDSEEIQR